MNRTITLLLVLCLTTVSTAAHDPYAKHLAEFDSLAAKFEREATSPSIAAATTRVDQLLSAVLSLDALDRALTEARPHEPFYLHPHGTAIRRHSRLTMLQLAVAETTRLQDLLLLRSHGHGSFDNTSSFSRAVASATRRLDHVERQLGGRHGLAYDKARDLARYISAALSDLSIADNTLTALDQKGQLP